MIKASQRQPSQFTYGHKADNLLTLQQLLGVEYVPALAPLAHEQLLAILQEEGMALPETWQAFLEGQGNETVLNEHAKEMLNILQQQIIQLGSTESFQGKLLNLPLTDGSDQRFGHWLYQRAKLSKSLALRSTGNEDSLVAANPGGNESFCFVEPTLAGSSHAIAKVLASYFSPKSLQQRLDLKDDIQTMPICPVLSQIMVGAKPLTQATITQPAMEKICSGVVYSREADGHTEGLMVIQSAYGHGKGVVESKVPADTFYTNGEFIDSTIRRKDYRIAPVQEGSEVKLVAVTNQADSMMPPAAPSLNPNEVKTLFLICKKIHDYYGQPQDIEWVYQDGVFQIVQTRPIPATKVAKLEPSYLTTGPEAILGRGLKIVNGFNAALELDNPKKQVLCTTNLRQALMSYLTAVSKKKEQIKLVLTEDNVAKTSHEAGFFRACSIPVLQIPHAYDIYTRMQDVGSVIYDEQHGTIVAGGLNEHQVHQGWAQHPVQDPLSLYALPAVLERLHTARKNAKEKISPLSSHDGLLSLQHSLQTLKDHPDEKNLMTVLLSLAKKYEQQCQVLTDQDLKDELDTVYSHIFSSAQDLAELLIPQSGLAITAQDKLKILYQIHRLETAIYQSEQVNVENSLSLKTVLAEAKVQRAMTKIFNQSLAGIAQRLKLSPQKLHNQALAQKPLVLQLLKLGKTILNAEKRQSWYDLVVSLSYKSDHYLPLLAQYITVLEKYNLLQMWLNKSFSLTDLPNLMTQERAGLSRERLWHEAMGKNVLTMVQHFAPTKLALQNYEPLQTRLKEFKSQIENWDDPSAYKKLMQLAQQVSLDLEYLLAELNKPELTIDAKNAICNMIRDYTVSYDLALKVLYESTEYDDKLEHGQQFQAMLAPFAKISNQSLLQLKQSFGQDLEEQMMWVAKDVNTAAHYDFLKYTNTVWQRFADIKLTKENVAKLMNPLADFYVNAAAAGSKVDYNRAIPQVMSLAGCHTLAHQNLLVALAAFQKEWGLSLVDLPPEIQTIHQSFKILTAGSVGYGQANAEIQLLGIELNYPTVTLHHNIPMRQHSGTLDTKIDYTTQPPTVNIDLRMFMWAEGGRTYNVPTYAHIASLKAGITITKFFEIPEKRPSNDRVQQEYHIAWQLPLNDTVKLNKLTAIIKEEMALTISTSQHFATEITQFSNEFHVDTKFFEQTLLGAKEILTHYRKKNDINKQLGILAACLKRICYLKENDQTQELEVGGLSEDLSFELISALNSGLQSDDEMLKNRAKEIMNSTFLNPNKTLLLEDLYKVFSEKIAKDWQDKLSTLVLATLCKPGFSMSPTSLSFIQSHLESMDWIRRFNQSTISSDPANIAALLSCLSSQLQERPITITSEDMTLLLNYCEAALNIEAENNPEFAGKSYLLEQMSLLINIIKENGSDTQLIKLIAILAQNKSYRDIFQLALSFKESNRLAIITTAWSALQTANGKGFFLVRGWMTRSEVDKKSSLDYAKELATQFPGLQLDKMTDKDPLESFKRKPLAHYELVKERESKAQKTSDAAQDIETVAKSESNKNDKQKPS